MLELSQVTLPDKVNLTKPGACVLTVPVNTEVTAMKTSAIKAHQSISKSDGSQPPLFVTPPQV